jgi:hypothetical protein
MMLTFARFDRALQSVKGDDKHLIARTIRATATALGIKDVVEEQLDQALLRANDAAWSAEDTAEELMLRAESFREVAEDNKREAARIAGLRTLIN